MAHTELKCPLCGGVLETGFLLDRGQEARAVEWVAGVPEPAFWAGVKFSKKVRGEVATKRCRECGHLLLFARKLRDPNSPRELPSGFATDASNLRDS